MQKPSPSSTHVSPSAPSKASIVPAYTPIMGSSDYPPSSTSPPNPFSPSMQNRTDPTGILTTIPTETRPADVPNTHPVPTGMQNCYVQPDGFFGSFGDSQIVVRYTYELETNAGTTALDVIPSLERAFSDAILPELFVEECHSHHGNVVLQSQLAATGVSTKPDDLVLQSLACGRANDGNSTCVVVKGELTLFVDGTPERIETEIVAILKDRMKNDKFLSAHDGIKRVTLVDVDSSANSGTGVEASPTPAPTSGPRLDILYGVLAALAALLLILAIVVWRRKHDKDADSQDEIVQGDESSDDQMGGEGEPAIDSSDLEL